jgi:hypothetical protein
MGSKFGFGETKKTLNVGEFPKSDVRRNGVSDAVSKSALFEETEKLGFEDRSGVKEIRKRKPGRKPSSIPRSQILINGPENVIDAFKSYCIKNGDISYWEGIESLLKK